MEKNSINKPINDIISQALLEATEMAALSAFEWSGRKEKEKADEVASDAIRETLRKISISGVVHSGEGIKDNAPGIFEGETLGTNQKNDTPMLFYLDPIDGTTNLSEGKENAISCISAVKRENTNGLPSLQSFYSEKIAYGAAIKEAGEKEASLQIQIDDPFEETLGKISQILQKPASEIKIILLNRPRNQHFVDGAKKVKAQIEFIQDGDILTALSPCIKEEKCDIYAGIGGTPEGFISAIGLASLGGEIQMREWEAERGERGETHFMTRFFKEEEFFFSASAIHRSRFLPGIEKEENRINIYSLIIEKGNYQIVKNTYPLSSKD